MSLNPCILNRCVTSFVTISKRGSGRQKLYSKAIWNLILLCHNSSSSSIFVSMVGMLPSEFPRSFCALRSAWPKLLRTLSSKPGNEARCFLKGDAIESCALRSFGAEDASPGDIGSGAGVPDSGDAEDSVAEGPPRGPSGSAECWRLSCRLSVWQTKTFLTDIP
jgi:hypothetical protein